MKPNARTPLPSYLLALPIPSLLTNHGRQHGRAGGLSSEHEQRQAPAERHFWSKDSSIERLEHGCSTLHQAHCLVRGIRQGHSEQAFPTALLPWHGRVMRSGDLQGEDRAINPLAISQNPFLGH